MRDAALIRIHGRLEGPGVAREAPALSPELAAALAERPISALGHIAALLRQDGWLSPALILGAALLAAGGAALEAFLLRGLLDLGRELGSPEQRLLALGAVAFVAVIWIERASTSSGPVSEAPREPGEPVNSSRRFHGPCGCPIHCLAGPRPSETRSRRSASISPRTSTG